MNDHIKVSFAELGNAAGSISSQAGQVEQQLEDLKSRLQPIINLWEGAASEAYMEKQRAWDTAAADLQSVLASIGVAVQQATEAYQAAEQQNLKRW
ncbi:WXG100 family type VII secretion target [Saccharothrix variisporea]|uniref:ESAT-6-like protein n=1 Tax=Saccharothrix variisporea TaxID=543527 RepID=A0A495XKP2_9PSEU|nr:WXG100 family type VII secretion target [Saccharothrix variisporea]RKT72158.1 early secretory antigenic target protein ESAT-6 [Saccharothrix variisporea]